MAGISLQQVSKVYPNGHAALHELSLEIADGELLVLVGPSGSGKSTVLRLIAGLEALTGGRIVIGGADVTGLPPQQRDLAMVFQNYALYPHKSVRDNLAFGLRVRGMDEPAIAGRVAKTAASLGIDGLLDRKPSQLSGGQRQRVALGRAIVREPRAFLLDEPLSNLDPLLRVGTRAELALLHRRLGATMVYVTHDQEEAMTLGTRIAVMNEGRIEQVAPPLETFERPATAFVARFVGSPAMNLWTGRLSREGGRMRLATPAFALDVEPEVRAGDGQGASIATARGAAGKTAAEGATRDGAGVLIGVRPHDVEVTAPGGGDADASVEVLEPLGAQTTVHVSVQGVPGELARVLVPSSRAVRTGERVGLRLRRDRVHLFDAADGRRLEWDG